MNLDNLTPAAVQNAVRTTAREVAARPESDGHTDAEIASTAKALVRTAFIQEHSWRALEDGRDEAEAEEIGAAIREACEAWNAIVDEVTGDGPANDVRAVRRCLRRHTVNVKRTGRDHILVTAYDSHAQDVREVLDGEGYHTQVHNDEDLSIYFNYSAA